MTDLALPLTVPLTRAALADQISHGAAQLRCGLPNGAAEQLADYLLLLDKWNARINLTAIRDLPSMVTHHVLDSLAIVPELAQVAHGRRLRIADVGTGAGLPGLVLAVAQPEWQLTCIDAVAKKIAFVQQAIGALQLANARAVASRVQDIGETFDVVTSRAYAALDEIIDSCQHLVAPGGVIAAMKGPRVDQEAQALPAPWRLAANIPLAVPGLNEQRFLAVLWRSDEMGVGR